MHAAGRTYTGPAAKELFKLLVDRRTDVEKHIRGSNGLVQYLLIPTDEGGVTVTVCKGKAGADESVRVARQWVQRNAAHLKASPPTVSEGAVAFEVR